MFQVICPVSSETINKQASRVGATATALLLVAYAVTAAWPVLVFVVLDYTIRVLTNRRGPIGVFAAWTVRIARVPPASMGKAPKIFAWRVGYAMALVAVLLLPVSPTTSIVVATVLAGFNILDGVGNFCVGCVTYTMVVFPYLGEKRGLPAD
ncbi:MAG: DUF4395 family protein [Dehalococcoidia bacterium]